MSSLCSFALPLGSELSLTMPAEPMKFENVLQRHRDLLAKNWYATGEAQHEKLYGGDLKKEFLLMSGANTTAHARIRWSRNRGI